LVNRISFRRIASCTRRRQYSDTEFRAYHFKSE